jgi:hypothetical protein
MELAFPFAIFGILFYGFVALFHLAIGRITAKNEEENSPADTLAPGINLFFLALIGFCIIYLGSVCLLQQFISTHFHIAQGKFERIGFLLQLGSLALSGGLSFLVRKAKSADAPPK